MRQQQGGCLVNSRRFRYSQHQEKQAHAFCVFWRDLMESQNVSEGINRKGNVLYRTVILRWLSYNHHCRGKAKILYILSVCLYPYLYSMQCACALLYSMQCACALLYCHPWPDRLYHIFPNYLINGTIFGRKLLNIKCIFELIHNFCVKHLSF